MPLTLRHTKGLNGQLLGSVQAIPNAKGPFTLAQVCGGNIILGSENNQAPQQLLAGHDGPITAWAMSHGGGLAASGQRGANSDVVLWDLGARAPRARLQEHDAEVAALAFSRDDRLLASAGGTSDAKLFVWDTSSGKIVARHALEPGRRVSCLAWSPAPAPGGRGYTLASVAGEELVLWSLDPFAGQLAAAKVVLGSVRRQYTALAFSPDGAWLLAATASADIVTVNVQRAAVQMAHPVCSGGIGALLLPPDSPATAIAGGRDGTLSTFPLAAAVAAAGPAAAWRELRPFATVPGAVTSLSLSSDGAALIVGTAQGAVYRLHRGTLQLAALSAAQPGPLAGVAFAAGAGDAVAVAGSGAGDGGVCVWSTADYALQCRVAEPAQAGGALCALLTPDSVISGWGDGVIRCHARGGGGGPCAPLWLIPGAHALAHSVGVTALGQAGSGRYLMSGGAGGEVRVWDSRSREMAAHIKAHGGRVVGVAAMADEGHVATASEDRSWAVWDIRAERGVASWRTQAAVRGLALSPDRVSAVTVTQDRKIQKWDLRAPEPVWTKVEAHGGEIGCVASDPRGATFATGGADCTIKLWDWQSGAELARLAPHSGPAAALAFAPDGRGLVSAALDGSIAFMAL